MNLFHLRYFVTLAQVRHYTKAAQLLCIAQPSLSHAIAQLEKELGVPLFEKNGRNTTLTRFGEEFLLCAQQTLSTLDKGVESLRRSARGEGLIRLGLLRTLGVEFVPRLAAEFLRENPQKEIQFTFHTGVTRQLAQGLAAGNYDLAFCSQPPEEMGLMSWPVQKQELVLIVPKGHPLAACAPVDLEQTLAYPQVFFSKSSGVRPEVDHLFSLIGQHPAIAYETEEDQVVAGLVAQGFGVAVVPYMDLLLKLEVDILSISSPAHQRVLYMVWNNQVFMPPAVARFHAFVRSRTAANEKE